MAFKFRLQSYLNVKEKIEEQRKLEYGRALSRLEEEKEKKEALLKQRKDTIDDFKTKLENKINPMLYKNINNYIQALKKRIIIQEENIVQAEDDAEQFRTLLVEAVKERKILDKLKEKELVEYNREQVLKEQKLIDEITSYKFNKRQEN